MSNNVCLSSLTKTVTAKVRQSVINAAITFTRCNFLLAFSALSMISGISKVCEKGPILIGVFCVFLFVFAATLALYPLYLSNGVAT